MKKIIFFTLLSIGFIACNGDDGLPKELIYPSTFDVSKIEMEKMRYYLIGDNGNYTEVQKSNSQNSKNIEVVIEDLIDNPDEATNLIRIKIINESKMEWTDNEKEKSEVTCVKNANIFTSGNPSGLRMEYFPVNEQLHLNMSLYFYYKAKTKTYAPLFFFPTPITDLDSEIKRQIKGNQLSVNDTLGINLAKAIYKKD